MEGTNPFRAPDDQTPARDRLQRDTALATVFLSDRELDALAWQVELALNRSLEGDRWLTSGDLASREALLETLERFRRLQ